VEARRRESEAEKERIRQYDGEGGREEKLKMEVQKDARGRLAIS
jgi:hypothetical protein